MEFVELLEVLNHVDLPLALGFLGLGKLFGGGNKEPKRSQKALTSIWTGESKNS